MIHIQWYWIVLIWLAGGFIGFFAAALCAAAAGSDRIIESIKHEPGSEADRLARQAVKDEEEAIGII